MVSVSCPAKISSKDAGINAGFIKTRFLPRIPTFRYILQFCGQEDVAPLIARSIYAVAVESDLVRPCLMVKKKKNRMPGWSATVVSSHCECPMLSRKALGVRCVDLRNDSLNNCEDEKPVRRAISLMRRFVELSKCLTRSILWRRISAAGLRDNI